MKTLPAWSNILTSFASCWDVRGVKRRGINRAYILLHCSLLNTLELGFWQSDPSYSGIQPTDDDALDKVVLGRVD